MSLNDDEITQWIDELKASDDPRAASAIWKQYIQKLMTAVRHKLGSMPRRATDEEDIALSAMNSFFRGVKAGHFPQLDDRTDLWKVLITIASRKVTAARRKHKAVKRGGGRVRGESALQLPHGSTSNSSLGMNHVEEDGPTPELVVEVSETIERLMVRLDDDLKSYALCKLEGLTNKEIAQHLDVALRTVERKLGMIREKWADAKPA